MCCSLTPPRETLSIAVIKDKDDALKRLQAKVTMLKSSAGGDDPVANRREIEISALLPPSSAGDDGAAQGAASGPPAPGVDAAGTEAIITELREQVLALRRERDERAEALDDAERRVRTRDGEIERLGRLLEGGRDLDKFNLECASPPPRRFQRCALTHTHLAAINETNQRIIETLNDQVDFLNSELAARDSELDNRASQADEIAELQRRLQENEEKRDALERTNKALMHQLDDLQDMARSMEAGAAAAESATDDDESDAPRAEMSATRKANAALAFRRQMQALQEENRALREEAARVAAVAEAYTSDKAAYEHTIRTLEEVRRRPTRCRPSFC